LRYLELDQKKEIADRITAYMDKNANYKIFKDNPEFLEAVVSVPGYMGDENPDHIEVCQERTRVLDLYDRIRGTDHKTLFPYIKRYE
jgi:hypothetical protein